MFRAIEILEGHTRALKDAVKDNRDIAYDGRVHIPHENESVIRRVAHTSLVKLQEAGRSVVVYLLHKGK